MRIRDIITMVERQEAVLRQVELDKQPVMALVNLETGARLIYAPALGRTKPEIELAIHRALLTIGAGRGKRAITAQYWVPLAAKATKQQRAEALDAIKAIQAKQPVDKTAEAA